MKPSDLPKAAVAHELMGLGLLAGSWGACYAIQPSQTIARPLLATFPSLGKSAGPRAIGSTLERATETIKRWTFLKKVPLLNQADGGQSQILYIGNIITWSLITTSFGHDYGPGRLVLSLAESSIGRNLLRPLTIPGKLWLAYQVALTFN